MALLIDDDFITQADLLAIDAEIADIADAEDLKIDGDAGIARQAWNENADALLDAMQAFGGDIIAWPGTLTTYGAFGISRPRLRLNQIVVSAPYQNRTSPLYRWMVYRTLVMFYRAASNRRTSDRYEKKWENFKQEVKAHWRTLFATGLPMVALPIACPGALHELMSGTWGTSNVTPVAGGTSTQDASLDVAITWVDGTQYVSPDNTQNAESGPSATATLTVPAGNVIQATIAGLNPPSGKSAMLKRGIADGPYITRTATGWNLYAGPSGGLLTLQNPAPIPVGTTTYTLPDAPAVGAPLLPGQFPDANYTFMRTLQRA
ncbi:MAG: hypothetical protein KGL39_37565 [Patescibacteria group bacterium]|nr:hypothetical protein [Patescibacteria group bacterium]